VEDEPDEEPLNGLVEALFDEIERLRLQVSCYKLIVATHTIEGVPSCSSQKCAAQ
jgi:hypothetical protein